MKRILLTKGKFAIVDDDDYERLSSYKYRAIIDSEKPNATHAARNSKSNRLESIYMTHDILNNAYGTPICHLNGNSLDNRKENLVISTISVIDHRSCKRERTSSIYKGVYSWKNYWRAQIYHKHIKYYLGYFGTEKDAALAYNRKARELYDEFAYQNKIEI